MTTRPPRSAPSGAIRGPPRSRCDEPSAALWRTPDASGAARRGAAWGEEAVNAAQQDDGAARRGAAWGEEAVNRRATAWRGGEKTRPSTTRTAAPDNARALTSATPPAQ